MDIQLPLELIEEILHYLAKDSRGLKTCSLVCRALVFRCRSYLFKTCRLTPNNIFGFCCLLRSPDCTFLSHVYAIHAVRHHWHQHDRWFNAIAVDMRRLTGVRALEMTLTVVDVSNADAFFRTGFVTAFLKVTRLVLNCNFGVQPTPLIDMICLFPALQELCIHDMSGNLADPPAIAVPPPGLHSLELSVKPAGPILAWLHAFNHLANVDSLTLPPLKQHHAQTVRAALQQLGGLLHFDIMLTWLLGAFDADPSTVFDLSLHPNLKTLTIRDCSWGESEELDPNQMVQLMTRLVAPALESLALDVDLSLYQSLDWTVLDDFLSSTRFPCLRKVAFKCRDSDRQFLRAALPLLEASGVLRMAW
ncbi:hypothetical protein MVEN_02622400 [Mycena venus]|uniref:F-box domain-containing protein n=1 Tax=Mycena venus TaxID=2733690 RepID=A0A8H6U031_9AGAR|nr:hypothetical protein MVEN_02622400 [Mycena venus]